MMPELGPWKRFVAAQSMAWFRLLSRKKRSRGRRRSSRQLPWRTRPGPGEAPGDSRARSLRYVWPFSAMSKSSLRPTLPSNKSNGKKETNKAKKKGAKTLSEELFSSLSAPVRCSKKRRPLRSPRPRRGPLKQLKPAKKRLSHHLSPLFALVTGTGHTPWQNDAFGRTEGLSLPWSCRHTRNIVSRRLRARSSNFWIRRSLGNPRLRRAWSVSACKRKGRDTVHVAAETQWPQRTWSAAPSTQPKDRTCGESRPFPLIRT